MDGASCVIHLWKGSVMLSSALRAIGNLLCNPSSPPRKKRLKLRMSCTWTNRMYSFPDIHIFWIPILVFKAKTYPISPLSEPH